MRSRRRLANRRGAETFDFEHAGHRFSLTVGRFSDGKPAEIFLSSSKPGSLIEAIARDAEGAVQAVTVTGTVVRGRNAACRVHRARSE